VEQILSTEHLARLEHDHLCAMQSQADQLKRKFGDQIKNLSEPHLWVPTSGTESLKWVGLSLSAIKCASQALNKALCTTSEDLVFAPLPLTHVSGLMPFYRSLYGGYRYHSFSGPWKPEAYVVSLNNLNVTLTSLVPTQVFDLVQRKLCPPSSLRHVLVGGAPLSPSLMAEAQNLGWPLQLSWGATETTAACALYKVDHGYYEFLPHMQSSYDHGVWILTGPSIATVIIDLVRPSFDLLEQKWQSSDQVNLLDPQRFVWQGRRDRIIKNRGEKVSLNAVQDSMQKFLWQKFQVLYDVYAEPMSAEREGQVVKLYVEASSFPISAEACLSEYNLAHPFELRAEKVVLVSSFDRSGKQGRPAKR
jgi:o-succinylbenzoate---CoA ligase